MKRIPYILLLAFMACFTATLWAQNAKKKEGKKPLSKADSTAAKIKYPTVKVPVYLGHSTLMGGPVQAQIFDSLLKQGITSKDSAGAIYKVSAFNFNYAELNLYEDSVGKLMVVPDYMFEHCFGDTLTTNISQSIYDRIKAGDTVYIDQISLLAPDSSLATGKTMKFEITK